MSNTTLAVIFFCCFVWICGNMMKHLDAGHERSDTNKCYDDCKQCKEDKQKESP